MSRRRPLLGIALAWILGVGLGRALDPATGAVWSLALGTVLATVGLFVARRPAWHVGIVTLIGLLGMLAHQAAELPTDRLYPRLDELDAIQGVVADFPTQTADRTEFVLNSRRLPGGVQVFHWHGDGPPAEIAYGDRVTIKADVEVPTRFAGFDYRAYLATRNVWGVASVWHRGQIEHRRPNAGHPFLRWAYDARLTLFEAIDAHLPPSQSALLKGLLFGERAFMSDDVEGRFRDAGVMHVLAVSGLHLAILLGLGWFLLRRSGRSVTQTYLLLIPLVFIYLAMVGFRLSLVRASLMLAFVALGWVIAERGWILKHWVDGLQGLSAAALVILIVHPPTLFNVSFQLSFSATAGILIVLQLALPRLNAWRDRLQRRWDTQATRWRRLGFAACERLATLGVITGAAQLAVAPVIAWHFQRLYLGALVANLAIVPLVTVVLWTSVVFLGLAVVGLGGLAGGVSVVLGMGLTLLLGAAHGFAQLPWAYVVIDRATLLAIMALLPLLLNPSLSAAIPWGLMPRLWLDHAPWSER